MSETPNSSHAAIHAPGAEEHARLIRSLRATLAKMELALGQIDVPICFIDHEGRLEWCNQPFANLTGKRKLDLLGDSIVRLLALRDQGEVILPETHPGMRLIGGDTSAHGTYELAPENGRPRTIEISGRRVPLPNEGSSAILVVKDITDRERGLRRDRLASLGSITSGMIHQINSPLGFARSNIEFIREQNKRGRLEPNQLESILEETLTGLDRISGLFTSVSAFSDKAGRNQKFDLAATIETAARLTMGQWDTVASLQIPPARGDTVVWGDPSGISQALMQLITNSAWAVEQRKKAGDDTYEGEIVISLEPLSGWCELVVTDNGVGVAEGQHEKIFEPFFSTQNETEAMGQGLFVARTIIEDLHGGAVSSEEVDEGARFVVRLPAYERE